MKKRIALLGSTGSIGTQALELITEHPDKYEVEVLTACNNAELLVQQAIQYSPNAVVIADVDKYNFVKEALQEHPIKVYAGAEALSQIVEISTIDLVLNALVGYAGLLPTINTLRARKPLALANKESLVVAGDLVMRLAAENRVPVIPVDSEHSAIFQCLVGERSNIEKIYLTASGGPFLDTPIEKLAAVTKHEALKHPNWTMGAKITIDSASMMNKGLEVIEAYWLFDVKPEQIEVLVHPQSIVHSMVQFEDGAIKAQMGLPNMKVPIAYAFSFPERLKLSDKRLPFEQYPNLTFRQPDFQKFRNLSMAYEALRQGGTQPCALNAANEVAVQLFLQDKISFLQMSDVVEFGLNSMPSIMSPDLDDYIEINTQVRRLALEKFA